MKYYKLKQPDHAKVLSKALDKMFKKPIDFSSYFVKTIQPKYLFWDKVQYLPRPHGVTAEEFWALVKFSRNASPERTTPVKDKNGNFFTWRTLPILDSFFHEIDMQFGGKLELSAAMDESSRQRFISRGIMEEAIASSQLEGASTTRRVARQMIVENRRPKNKSEHMILNNYRAMIHVEEHLRKEPLTASKVLEFHRILTENTIPEQDQGRLRRNKDQVLVVDPTTNMICHVPPDEKSMKSQFSELIKYANNRLGESQFAHPVIKAIILHFWIGYLHPFVDGNGRLARLIFYWYLLSQDYWAFSFLPLSKIIKAAPAQYRDAYIYTEQDENDLTYFIDYNVRKILQAKEQFESYVRRVEKENKKMALIARNKYHLNDRQIQVLRYLHKNAAGTTTIKTHAFMNKVVRITARRDLEQLERLGFLKSAKVGKVRPFAATNKTIELFG